jgi:hypothetical protein
MVADLQPAEAERVADSQGFAYGLADAAPSGQETEDRGEDSGGLARYTGSGQPEEAYS